MGHEFLKYPIFFHKTFSFLKTLVQKLALWHDNGHELVEVLKSTPPHNAIFVTLIMLSCFVVMLTVILANLGQKMEF